MPDVHSPGHGPAEDGVIWPGGASKQGPHRVGAFAVCPQLEGFGYELMLRPQVEKDATVIGTLVHAGLAYRYGVLLTERPDWLVYPDGRHAIWICGQKNQALALESLRIYDAYCAHWDPLIARGAVLPWRPLLVEHQFEVSFAMPYGPPEPYTARLDLLCVEGDEIILVDHKTKKRITRTTGSEYRSDRQMLTQLALSRAFGYDVKRIVINAMTREQPEPRFARFDVPLSHEAFARLGQDTEHVLRQIRDVRTRYPDPTNRPRVWESCIRKYGPCDFLPLCTDGLHRIAEFSKRT